MHLLGNSNIYTHITYLFKPIWFFSTFFRLLRDSSYHRQLNTFFILYERVAYSAPQPAGSSSSLLVVLLFLILGQSNFNGGNYQWWGEEKQQLIYFLPRKCARRNGRSKRGFCCWKIKTEHCFVEPEF